MRDKISVLYNRIKLNKFFSTTIKTYLLIALVTFAAFALVMILNVYHAAITQLTSAELKMLSQSEKSADRIIRDMNASADYVFEREIAAIDAMSKPYTPEISYAVSFLISEMKNRVSALENVYFFNLKNNCIYTGDNPVYTAEDFPDRELLSLLPRSAWYTVNAPHILIYDNGYERKESRTLLSLYKYSDQSCMAVFINSDTFNGMVNADFSNKDQEMSILKSDGTVVSSTNPDLFGKNLSDDPIIQKITDQRSDSGYINKNGRIYCYKKSTTLNSLYMCSFRSSSVVVSYIWLFLILILFTMLLLLLYLVSSIKISISLFRPFSRLRDDVFNILDLEHGETDSTELGTDADLAFISKNLENIREKYNSMQETELLYSESVRNELVYEIMTGSYAYSEEELDEYNIRFPLHYNTMLLIRLDNTKSIARSNIGRIQYGIANAGAELLTSAEMNAYSTTYSDEYDVLFLINHGSPSFDISCIERLQKYVRYAFGITVSVSYDTAKNSLDLIPQMYSNVKYAMQYRVVKGHEALISYKTILKSVVSQCEYPDKLERNVLREINAHNTQGAASAIQDFIDAISDMPYSYIVVYSSMLTMAVMSVSKSRNSEEEKNSEGQDIISQEIMRIETISELRDMLTAKCSDAIINTSSIELDDKHMMIARSIESYINEHYNDPNLSVDIIASHVNKSANYARSIFKQHIGVSISNYIAEKRLDDIKRMLAETDLSIKVIAQKAGVNPGSYFFTAFKKNTGFTPEQYRNHYRKQN